jgi:hypothetical protein
VLGSRASTECLSLAARRAATPRRVGLADNARVRTPDAVIDALQIFLIKVSIYMCTLFILGQHRKAIDARCEAAPEGHFVRLFRIPTVFGKRLYFQYVLSFVFGKTRFPALCFQYVLSFVFFALSGHNVAMEWGGIEAWESCIIICFLLRAPDALSFRTTRETSWQRSLPVHCSLQPCHLSSEIFNEFPTGRK